MYVLALLALLGSPVRETKAQQPGQLGPCDPLAHVLAATDHLKLMPPQDRPYIVFVSFWDSPTPATLSRDVRFFRFWCLNMSFEPSVTLPQPVPGTGGRLWWLDIRNFRWTKQGWQAVAERDFLCQEPWIPHPAAQELRELGGWWWSAETIKRERYPVISMVNGGQFLRDTLDTFRSPSYYDLLFGYQRYGESYELVDKVVKVDEAKDDNGIEYHTAPDGTIFKFVDTEPYLENGKSVHGKWVKVDKKPAKVLTPAVAGVTTAQIKLLSDFPKDQKDWEHAFGVDVIKKFAKESYLDVDFGAIALGGNNYPGDGSIVALQDRLIAINPTPFGTRSMETFDVLENTGVKDYTEVLIFKGEQGFVRGRGTQAVRDAGELLVYLPNGGQAGLLVDGNDKRLELGGSQFVNDTADKRAGAGIHLSKGITGGGGSCIGCHSASGGFILPKNAYGRDLQAGIDRKFADPDKRNRVKAFFQGWENRMKGEQEQYVALVALATVSPFPGDKAWTGADVAGAMQAIRHDFDDPLDVAAASRKLGLPVEAFKWLASRTPDVVQKGKPSLPPERSTRPLQLLQGLKVPSRTFEVDTVRDIGLLLDGYRKDPDFERLFIREGKP